ncbi:hypothetical protein C8035_v009488 [Colletotrichum spinosum]|nr:hypothetical protein C8035_v009488 [Colletotrichum spinosum]
MAPCDPLILQVHRLLANEIETVYYYPRPIVSVCYPDGDAKLPTGSGSEAASPRPRDLAIVEFNSSVDARRSIRVTGTTHTRSCFQAKRIEDLPYVTMVALRFLLVLLPLAAASPSSPQPFALVKRHCEQPKNCGAVIQGTACDFCCAADVKPDSTHCKPKNAACDNPAGGQTFLCED